MENPIILHSFYWEMATGNYAEQFPEEKDLWLLLKQRAVEFKEIGFDYIWLPPANKGAGGQEDVGYGTYDLWDLGEFDQKGTVRTKYGNRAELEAAIAALHKQGLKVIYDAVLNHRLGADEKEQVELKDGSKAEVWTKFNFNGRNDKYSKLKLDWENFDGVDWNARTKQAGKFLFKTKEWDNSYEEDYLMGADLDYDNQEIRNDVISWGKWLVRELGFDGFRFDASKHVDNQLIYDFVEEVSQTAEKDLFFVGEAWENNPDTLIDYLNTVGQDRLTVFDFALRNIFVKLRDGQLDFRWLGDKGLVNQPDYQNRAVTFVDNHDTERDGENQYGTESIFRRKLQAYCYILMRKEGVPSIFWKDYYNSNLKDQLQNLITARKKFAYGDSYENETNDKNTYSYIRSGDEKHAGSGLVMLITQAVGDQLIEKEVNTGSPETKYYDFTANVKETVTTNADAVGNFKVKASEANGYSVWVKSAE